MLTLSERSQRAWVDGDNELSNALWQAHLAEAHEDACKTASIHINEAMSQYATEDFLSDVISHITKLSKSRVTKADVTELITMLEQKAQELDSASEYGVDELKKAKFEMQLYTQQPMYGKRVYR